MKPEDIRLIVQNVEARNPVTPLLLPATVANFSESTSIATLVVDGDPPDSTVEASVLIGDLFIGDRVMVLFDKPSGVYVVGRITDTAPVGHMIVYGDLSAVLEPSGDPNDSVTTETIVNWRLNRLYKITLTGRASTSFSDDFSVSIGFSWELFNGSTSIGFTLNSDTGSAGGGDMKYIERFFVADGEWQGTVSVNAFNFDNTNVGIELSYGIQDLGPTRFSTFF